MSVPAPVYRPGSWCDVAVWIDGRLIQVTVDGPLVRCYLEDTLVWQQPAPEPLLFCRGAVQGNLMLTVHQGQSGQAWLIGDGLARAISGITFGVQPVGIDAHEAFIVRSAALYDRLGLVGQPMTSGAPGSSQGLSDVQPDGTLWFADVHRTVVISGVTFTYPNQRTMGGGYYTLTVGQVDPPGIAVACEWWDDEEYQVRIHRVIEGDAFEPHVAVSPTGRVAICARTGKGAAYVTTTIQELSA